jgi:transcription termination/antitermination protein NusG
MNMEYQVGQVVGYVDIDELRGPIETPIPERWYVLRTFPNKERKVMETFEDRNISAYFPTVRERQRITRRRGGLSFDIWREINPPLFSGIIFIPDFQAKRGGVEVDGVEGYFRMGDCYPYLTPKLRGRSNARGDWRSAGSAKTAPLDDRAARVCEGWSVRAVQRSNWQP